MYFLDRKMIDEMEDTQSELRRGFQQLINGGSGEDTLPRGFLPPVDMMLGETRLTVIVELAGVERRDVQLGLVEDELVIQGTRRSPVPQEVERFFRMELSFGEFERRITLPAGLDTDDIDANYRDGFLVIHIARMPGAKIILEAEAEE